MGDVPCGEKHHRLNSDSVAFGEAPAATGKKRNQARVPIEIPVAGGAARHPAFVPMGRTTTGAFFVSSFDFPRCPICLTTEDLTAEHVPMGALGGATMTKTCRRCNNGLATAEEALRRVVDGEVEVAVETRDGQAIRGPRRGTAILRQQPGAAPMMLITHAHPEFASIVNGEHEWDVKYDLLDSFPAIVAVLKYSYLAACLWLREIPESTSAEQIRALLLAVRDGDADGMRLHAAILQRAWPFERMENADSIGTIALLEPSATHTEWMFALAGRIAVRWPLADIDPHDRRTN